LNAGVRQTEAQLQICRRLGVEVDVLAMSDRPVRTRVLAAGRWWSLQEYMIRAGAQDEIDDVQFHGARGAGTTPEVLDAITAASAILIGPSNPVISIGPMLAIRELREALVTSPAPVVAVSPLVGGQVLKGPTAAFMRQRGVPVSADGIATLYDGLIDGLVADEPASAAIPLLRTELLMDGAEGRRRLASEALEFALTLSGSQTGN
jgi:LPPG:FO 2-phospho-L-lactate transferase